MEKKKLNIFNNIKIHKRKNKKKIQKPSLKIRQIKIERVAAPPVPQDPGEFSELK